MRIIISLMILINIMLGETEEDGIYYLNKIREESGLNTLKWNKELWKSAKNHSNYIKANNIPITHTQELTVMFSGKHPWDRAEYVGYNNKGVSENISGGIKEYKLSIDMLLTAIYHRFGFLDFNIDEIGFYKNEDVITYNMGNTNIRKICEKKKGDYKVEFCNETEFVNKEELKNLNKTERENPIYIIYPYQESMNNLPVFYDESPDPIPDRNVTGNPISIQFNKSKVKYVEMKSFKLFEGYKEIENKRILTEKNDPNKRLSEYEYVLFPLDRLKWGKRYTAEFKGTIDGKYFEKRWDFYTKRLDGEIYIIRKPIDYEIWKNKNYYLSFEPDNFGRIEEMKSTCEGTEFIDYNTIKVNIKENCIIKIKNQEFKLRIK